MSTIIFRKENEHNNLSEGDNTMKNLTELLKSEDVGTTEGLVNLFVSAAVRGGSNYICFLCSRRNCLRCYKSFSKEKSLND